MNKRFKRLNATLANGLLAGAAVCIATAASAQEVTLKSDNGTINLTGVLVEITEDSYIIETSDFGEVRVQRDYVDCLGDGCPPSEAVDPMVVTWDVSLWGQRRAFTEHSEKLAELLAERTGGKFTLNLSYGGLSEPRENLSGIAAGDFEMAQFCAGYHPDENLAITVLELPFLGVDSLEKDVELSKAVFNHPAVREDMARWNATLLMPSPEPQSNVIGTGFPPTSLQSFDGMRIRATGGVGEAIRALGAEPVSLPAPEVKDALSSGDISAAAFAPHAHMAFGTIADATWWTTNLNPGTSSCPVIANSDAIAALPDEYRTLLIQSAEDALAHYLDYYTEQTMTSWIPTLRENEVIELTINDEILNEINTAVATPAAQDWIARHTAAGLPADDLFQMVRSIIDEG